MDRRNILVPAPQWTRDVHGLLKYAATNVDITASRSVKKPDIFLLTFAPHLTGLNVLLCPNNNRGEGIVSADPSARLSVRSLTPISRDVIFLYLLD